MNKDKEDLEKLVSELVDGKKIDWQFSKDSNPKEADLLNQFEAIDKISQAFGVLIDDEPIDSVDLNGIIFEWGHLQVLEKIGEGSYGEVYRAYDPVLDRNVALKLLKKEKSSGFQSRAFMQEAKRLAKVRNRHVLAVHGANIHDSRVGIWSDLINGENLSQGIQQYNKQHNQQPNNYSYEQLIHVITSLADALNAVHGAGLIHGDIKPSNIMKDNNGKLILMDFGAGTENNTEYTPSGYVVATPLLMSPELFKDDNISTASDIYALGVLLFKLATGRYPIEAKNISDIQQAHENKTYLTLDNLRPDLPKPLRKLIHQMMSYDSIGRPFAKDIQNKINWIVATPTRRNKQLSFIIIFILLLLGLIISTTAYYRVKQEEQNVEAVNSFMLQMINSTARLGKGREARVADILDYASKNVNRKFANQPYARATIHDLLGNSYINLKLPESSLKQLIQSLDIKQQLYDKNDPEVLSTMYLIAYSHHKLGNHQESNNIYNEMIQLAKIDSQHNAQIIQLAKIRLAQIQSENGELLEAEKQLIVITQNISVENDINGDNGYLSLFALANNYIAQSKFKKAEETAKKSLAWLKKYSKNSQDNINSLNALIAETLANQGRFKEAETIYRQALAEAEKLYGVNNAGYFSILTNLGGILSRIGKAQEGMELQIQALEISKKIQGEKSVATIIIGINLANTKVSLGDYKGGEKLMRSTLEDAMNQIGVNHIETLKLEYNLAELLNNTGRFSEAEKLATRNNAKMLKTLGVTHLFTLLSNDNIAVSLTGQKNYNAAIQQYQYILTNIDKTIGIKNPYYQLVLSHYVEALLQSNQKSKAKESLEKLINLQTDSLGGDHVDTLKSKNTLAELLDLH